MRIITISFMLVLLSCRLSSQVTEEPSGRVSGLFFIDYFFNALMDDNIGSLSNNVLSGGQGVNGFRIRRIYFAYDYRFNSKLSTRFRLESDEDNFTSNLDMSKANKFGMFVKDAYINWNYTGNHSLIIGIQGTPAFEISESVWGNRYIEKTIMDLRKIVPSRDLALSLKGHVDRGGILKYWLMVGNNSAGNPENDRYKRYFLQTTLAPTEKIVVSIYGDLQTRQPTANQLTEGETLANNITTTAIFLGYNDKEKLTTGIEAYYRSTQNGYLNTGTYSNLKGFGYSLFATYHFSSSLNLYGRFDRFEPNNAGTAAGDTRNLFIAGVAFKPESRFIISPNIFIEQYERTSSGDIKNSVTGRVTFSMTF